MKDSFYKTGCDRHFRYDTSAITFLCKDLEVRSLVFMYNEEKEIRAFEQGIKQALKRLGKN
ncbi:MAG: hypothetical protein AN487_16215 [Anabaena sp. CRKS33]|jgi:hypothetical protein|nr:MAG: hypothetical protein AN487_16215 [Anabaena sp. CRKS33]